MSIFDFLTMCTANTGKVSQQLVPKEDNCQSSSPEWTSKRWVAAVFASIHVWLQGSGYTSQVITSIPCSAGHGFEQCSNPQREQCMQPSTILWGPFSDTSPISPFDGFFYEKTMDYGLVIQLKICEKNRERDGKKCLFDASQVRVSSCFEVTPSPIPLGRTICCILPHLHAGINISSCDTSWWLRYLILFVLTA